MDIQWLVVKKMGIKGIAEPPYAVNNKLGNEESNAVSEEDPVI